MYSLILAQVGKLFFFLLVGYVLRRCDIMPDNTPTVLSKLTLWVLRPALSFQTFVRNFTLETLKTSYILLLAGIGMLLVLELISHPLAKLLTKDLYMRNICSYSMTIPNYGYIGYVLILALFGEETLLKFQIFCLPIGFYIYGYYYPKLLGIEKVSVRSMINAPMIALVAGAVGGLAGLRLPAIVSETLTSAANCMGPVTMILTGCTIAHFAFKDILCDWRTYAVVLIRMIVYPLFVFAVCRLTKLPRELTVLMVAYNVMPTGLNTVVFPSSVGKDCRLGAGMACVSNVFCIVSIPLLLALVM